jgi:hypothetical protein
MGKRELVLVAVFIFLGIVIYQVTAPPPPPGAESFSFGGLIRGMRRGVQGPRETATADSALTAPAPQSIAAVRVSLARTSDVTITGEDRDDVSATLHVVARGFDANEASSSAHGPKLKLDTAGDAIVLSIDTSGAAPPSRTQPPPVFTIALAVPRRLAIRAEPHIGRFVLSNVASADIASSRGETKITDIPGDLRLTHNGGTLEIAAAGSLKLTARNSRGTVKGIASRTSIDGAGGDLTLSDIAGPLEIESHNTDFIIDAGARLTPPLRITMTGGSLRVTGLRVEARIDGRNSELDIRMDGAAPVNVYNLGEILLTPPPDGYTLDATASEGRITVEDAGITASEGPDSHAEGKVRGGGPSIALRTTRGRIDVRQPAGK